MDFFELFNFLKQIDEVFACCISFVASIPELPLLGVHLSASRAWAWPNGLPCGVEVTCWMLGLASGTMGELLGHA